MNILIDGKAFSAEEMSLVRFPDLAKRVKKMFMVTGPRGAKYWLNKSVRGDWWMLGLGRFRSRTIAVKSVVLP